MQVQFKLLLPTIFVAIAAVIVNFYLQNTISKTGQQQSAVTLVAQTVMSAADTTKNTWLLARRSAYRDIGQKNTVLHHINSVKDNIYLLINLEENQQPKPVHTKILADLDSWSAIALNGERKNTSQQLSMARYERRLSDGFADLALSALNNSKELQEDFENIFVDRVQVAIIALWTVAFLATIICLYLVRSILFPLRHLVQEAERAASADGVAHFKPMDRHDEIGRLSTALAQMLSKINEHIKHIARMAFIDTDTGLPNRAKLHGEILSSDTDDTLFIISIKDWERIESVFGSSISAKVAFGVASRLNSALSDRNRPDFFPYKTILFSRLSPSIFALFIKDATLSNKIIENLSAYFLEYFETTFQIEGRAIRLIPQFSVSSTAFLSHDSRDEALIDAAILALDQAKRQLHAPSVSIFSTDMRDEVIKKRDLEEQIRNALVQNEFKLFFQPFIGMGGSTVMGGEALIRWPRPEGGLMPPGVFIPVAEETGLITQIDDWVVAEACRTAKRWKDAGFNLVVSANVSPLRFEQDGFDTLVAEALQTSGASPKLLKLEVTETVAMADPKRTAEILQPIKDLGIQIAIDDFGAGYSNLSTLGSLPVDWLKIDRSLVPLGDENHNEIKIMRAVANLASDLGLNTIVEGVEETWQAEFAWKTNCTIIQGFYYSKPLEEQDFLNYVRCFENNTNKAC